MKGMLSRIRDNWKSGITVSLVSIPLSISLAVASGASPIAGLITAVWAGLIASIFGGSNYNIVGPAGALSGILAAFALTQGAALLPMLAIISGLMILLVWAFKFEKYIALIPGSTIHGFTIGIALILILNQLNFAFGLTGLPKHEHFIQNVFESFRHINHASSTALIVFGITLVLLFVLLRFAKKIPGVLALTPFGLLLGYLSVTGKLPFTVATLGSQYSDLSVRLFQMPHFAISMPLVITAATVALVAIIETLLSAKIADIATKTHYDKRKEVFGLSLANIASGLMGGLPATGVFARTSLNIKTNANHKTSAGINAIAIALISFLVFRFFTYIPLPVIGAFLTFVAIRLVEVAHLKKIFVYDRKNFALMVLVAAVTVYTDPMIGIIVGTAISLLVLIDKLSKGQFELIVNGSDKRIIDRIVDEKLPGINHKNVHTLVYSVKGQLAYINVDAHRDRFEKALNGYENVIVRLRELYLIDGEGIEALDEIIELVEKSGKKILVTGANPMITRALGYSEAFNALAKKGQVFDHTHDALKYLGYQ